MHSINLYQPGIFDLSFDFPQEWNELSPEEVIFIAKILLQQTEENALEARPEILKFMLERRSASLPPPSGGRWVNPGVDFFNQLDPEDLVINCFPLLDFIFSTNTLTNLPQPIAFGQENYFPVSFEKLTCGEYEDADQVANTISENPTIEALAKWAAIFFRPLKGDDITPYMQFNYRTNSYLTYKSDFKEKYFLKLPPEQLYAWFIWYSGCRAELPGMFPDAFDPTSSGEPDMLAFTKCIHSGAGPKNGTRQQIRAMPLYEFLFDMDQEAAKAKELEALYKENKPIT